jgi:hypothetical protein
MPTLAIFFGIVVRRCHDDHPPPLSMWNTRDLNRWTESKEPTVIKVLNARKLDTFKLEIDFSDRTQGVFDAAAYLATRSGPLLDKLRDPNYFSRFFIDAGALCWPNGLEISPAKVHELSAVRTIA